MQLTATLPDESLEGLATRVYDLGEKASQSRVRGAVRALRDANPALAKMADVQPGTVVEVPPLEESAHRPGATMSEDAIAAGLVRDHVAAAAALLGRQLFEDLSAELSDANETLKARPLARVAGREGARAGGGPAGDSRCRRGTGRGGGGAALAARGRARAACGGSTRPHRRARRGGLGNRRGAQRWLASGPTLSPRR
jgi:hypothetical protein